MDGRAWRYAQELGFSTLAGNPVQITFFEEEGEFKASSILDLTTLYSVTLRAESGRPYWA